MKGGQDWKQQEMGGICPHGDPPAGVEKRGG